MVLYWSIQMDWNTTINKVRWIYFPIGKKEILKKIIRSFRELSIFKQSVLSFIKRRDYYRDKDWKEWNRLRNLYVGRSGFVIGNGPSLKIKDLDKLTKKITIASNRIYLAYDKTPFRPTLLTLIDNIVANKNSSI